MRGANILTGVAVLAWVGLSVIGLSLLQGVVEQNIPGYPNSGQIQYYVVYPLVVAALLVACGWFCNRIVRRPAALGCLAAIALFSVLIYMLGFGGGI